MARKPKPSGRKRLSDKGRPLGRRRVNMRPLRPRFLIVCEGSKTEPSYSYGPNHNPERDNPSTTVHQLVEELNRCAR